MNNLLNKHILLGVTGGIAAYKSPEIVRRLRDVGAKVRVVMTRSAKEFITPLTLQAVSGHPVSDDLLDPKAEAAMGHIELARWADLILIAPATANIIAELAAGQASDLLTTLSLATLARKVVVPAMNHQMWQDPATQQNIRRLQERDLISIIGPAEGQQACGDVGVGRMVEPGDIVAMLGDVFETQNLSGLHLLMTAGPTREAIDPIRFISNKSSGKMGYALAQAAVEAGAKVTMVSGPVHIPKPSRVDIIDVISAQEMYDAVMAEVEKCDIFMGVAAVADYRIKAIHPHKIKKSNSNISLALERTPDILAAVASLKKRPALVVGFAAETQDLLKHAEKKLTEKKLDFIVANQIASHVEDRTESERQTTLEDSGFGSDYNAATVLWHQGSKHLPLVSKRQLARMLVKIISEKFREI